MPGIEVRTYQGDAAEFASFVGRAWTTSYEGRFTHLVWDAPYFEWQLFSDRPEGREFVVAAYEGVRLAGVLASPLFPIELFGEPIEATITAWFSVDPEYRGRRVGRLLVDESRRRHRERGVPFSLGFVAAGMAGHGFWKAVPDCRTVSRVGFWYRVLDAASLARAVATRRDRWLTRLLGPLSARALPASDEPGVRPYRAGDLEACRALVDRREPGSDLRFRWPAERLARQLDHAGTPRTLVLESAGRVAGVVNWYESEVRGRGAMRMAFLDLLAFAGGVDARGLLRGALRRMREGGAALAMLPRLPGQPRRALLRTGFVPLPAEQELLGAYLDPIDRLARVRRPHFLWR